MSNDQKKIIAKNLTRLIEQNGVQKKDLANAVGVANSQITHWVSGRSAPRTEYWDKIADFFGVNKNELLFDASDYDVDANSIEDERLIRLNRYWAMMSPECRTQLLEMAKTLAKLSSEVNNDD